MAAETGGSERPGAALARIIGDEQSRQLAELRRRFNRGGWGIVAAGPDGHWWAVRGDITFRAASAAELSTLLRPSGRRAGQSRA